MDKFAASLSLLVFLAGCGGGDSSSSPPAPAPPPPAPSGLTYPAAPAMTVNTAIAALTPSVTGTVTSYTVSPALPAGLALNSTTGAITGTPMAVAPKTTYTVSAGNSTGSTTFGLDLTVNDRVPAFTYPNTSYNFTAGMAIANLVPTSTGGTPASWSVTPAMSNGLAFDTNTGVISGTPLAVTAAVSYTVAASNVSGSASQSISITVNDRAPVIAYPNASYTLTSGTPAPNITPTNTGGTATGWTVTPALPTGLALDAATGAISGTPRASSPSTNYHVTATNSGGSGSFDIAIAVARQALVDLGHASAILDVKLSGQRLLSADYQGRVVLWNAQTGEKLFKQFINCKGCGTQIDLAGGTAAIRHDQAITLLNASDGSVRAKLAVSNDVAWWRLASDGSYVCAGGPQALYAWSANGDALFNIAGDYRAAKAFAAPGELRLAAGPAGAQVIQKISVPSGNAALSPVFQGTFNAWFLDGSRFFSNAANNVWIYSSDAAQQELIALPTLTGLAGRGNRFWTATATLSLYSVGGATTPDFTYSVGPDYDHTIEVDANVLAVLKKSESRLQLLDLDATSPVLTDYTTLTSVATFGANSANDWAFGTDYGVVMGEVPPTGEPQIYSHGALAALAGNDQILAYATSSGHIFYRGPTLEPQGDITFLARHLSLSADGTLVLADTADNNATRRVMRFYQLPSNTLLHERVYNGSPYLLQASLSASGTVVGEVLDLGPVNVNLGFDHYIQRNVTDLSGGLLYSDMFQADLLASRMLPSVLALAPDGAHHAALSGTPNPDAATSIQAGSNLVGAAPGVALGWIDNSRLLLYRTAYGHMGGTDFLGTDIVNLAGQVQSSFRNADVWYFQPLAGNRIYVPYSNKVISLADGSVAWSSPSPSSSMGAVVGSNVVFLSGAEIIVEPL